MVHGENHFLLRIKNLRDSDFGTYTCGHNTTSTLTDLGRSGVDQGRVTDSIEVSGKKSRRVRLKVSGKWHFPS